MIYTVVALYEDDLSRYCTHVEAANPYQAEQQARDNDPKNPIIIAGVFEDRQKPVDDESYGYDCRAMHVVGSPFPPSDSEAQ
jgi:hypothetical protein